MPNDDRSKDIEVYFGGNNAATRLGVAFIIRCELRLFPVCDLIFPHIFFFSCPFQTICFVPITWALGKHGAFFFHFFFFNIFFGSGRGLLWVAFFFSLYLSVVRFNSRYVDGISHTAPYGIVGYEMIHAA